MARALWLLALLLLAPMAEGAGGRAAALVQYIEGASPPAPGGLTDQLPATRVDASFLASRAPEGRPESALAHFRELQRLLLLRSRTGAPVDLEVTATLGGPTLLAKATLAPRGLADTSVTLVLVEDGARVTMADGPREARFVARAIEGPMPLAGSAGLLTREVRFDLDPSWRTDRLLVVAYATREGEGLQAAVWPGNPQSTKLVLVEHATASWCAPCAPSDDSFSLLASQQGDASGGGAGDYARAPDMLALMGLALGLLVATVVWRRPT